MKVLLINPPSKYTQGSGKPALGIPLGLLSIAGLLEKEKHAVTVYDTKASLHLETHEEYTQLGDSFETIKEKIKQISPEVLGISNPYTVYSESARKIAQIAKEVNKNIKVVVGGPHATIAPKEFLEDNNTDFVVMREGEFPFLNILRFLEGKEDIKKISDIAYRDNEIRINPPGEFIDDLDKIPFPAYHLVDMEVYFRGIYSSRSEYTNRAVSMVTSRGCPYLCNFCSIFLHMGRKFRVQSPEYVINHVKLLVNSYHVKLIHFEDDNLTLDQRRFEAILDGFIENKLKFKWDTPNGVRADALTKPLLEKCKKTGCQYLIIGVESGNQEVLEKVIHKKLDLNRVIKAAQMCKEVGIPLEAFFIVGFPGETLENMRETFEFAKMLNKKYNVYPSIHVAVPLLNTPLYEQCKENNYFAEDITPENMLTAYSRRGGIIKTEDFCPEDIESLFDEYKSFILKARIMKAIKHPYLIKSYVLKQIAKSSILKPLISN